MAEELKEKGIENYQFINEKIVPKRKKKWLKRLGSLLFVAVLAAVFGIVARAAFLLSGDYLEAWFGVEEKRQEVDLPKPTEPAGATLSPTQKPTKTPTPKPTMALQETLAPTLTPMPTTEPTEPATPTVAPMPEPEATPGAGTTVPEDTPVPTMGADEPEVLPGEILPITPEATPTAEPTEEPVLEPTPNNAYLQIYESIRELAKEVSDSFVTVEAVEQGVDWFQEVYEKRTRTTGLILGNDGVDLLILVGTEQFAGATYLEVTFGEEVISGSIYSMDKDYGLAVIAVPLKEISQELLQRVQPGILAKEEDIVLGTPVIALGAPNGYEGSMEFGMITSLGSTVSVTDGEVAYFTTDIMEYPGGYGFVVNLQGEILGMITHTHKENKADGIFSAVSLDSIRGVIIKLLNNVERAYFGIKGLDLPKNLVREYGLTAGVYVSEVENASPALASGIKAGDILVAAGGEPLTGIRSFSDVILERSTREIIQIKLLRKAEDGLREMTVEVSLTGKK